MLLHLVGGVQWTAVSRYSSYGSDRAACLFASCWRQKSELSLLSLVCRLFLLCFYFWSHPAVTWLSASTFHESSALHSCWLSVSFFCSIWPADSPHILLTFCSIFIFFTLELWEFHKCSVRLSEIMFLSSVACSDWSLCAQGLIMSLMLSSVRSG